MTSNSSSSSKLLYLVTGAAGFIGSRFVQSCRKRGIDVISVDQLSHFKSRPEHAGIDYGTLVDREELQDWLPAQKNVKPSAIVHLGACTDTTELDETYLRRMNLNYTQALWAYASKERVPFTYASSAATYGDGSLGYDDDENLISRLRALNPYGESKRLFDVWALEQEKNGITPPHWSGFKFFNVYGPGERHKQGMASVVLHAFDQIQASGKVNLFRSHREGIADGHQSRDFIFVDDAVNVLHFALSQPIQRGIYNLGTGKARTYLDLARAVFHTLGLPEKIDFVDTPVNLRERYQYFTEAKMARLRNEGYPAPFTSLEEGVAQYVTWLRAASRS
ncbi:MAG: ADP-glyceromanno-heptose 6-epimerase [Bdellovibrionales bacterium GWB1_55_8]|nr:MAG: ADP-glyceromanno-heptose 6-epimerase [Bdellovibrionales bacterium GWB1_55_8]